MAHAETGPGSGPGSDKKNCLDECRKVYTEDYCASKCTQAGMEQTKDDKKLWKEQDAREAARVVEKYNDQKTQEDYQKFKLKKFPWWKRGE